MAGEAAHAADYRYTELSRANSTNGAVSGCNHEAVEFLLNSARSHVLKRSGNSVAVYSR